MRYDIAIWSMHCEHCAANLERYLRDQPGVTAAAVDFEAERGRVTVGPDASVEGLLEAIEAMGYEADLVGSA